MTRRFKLTTLGDCSPAIAARQIGLSVEELERQLPQLLQRGFPGPDATTGNYDLDAIEAWRRARHPQLFNGPSLTATPAGRNADVVLERLARIRGG